MADAGRVRTACRGGTPGAELASFAAVLSKHGGGLITAVNADIVREGFRPRPATVCGGALP